MTGSYVNSDVATAYQLIVNGDSAAVSGEIIRFDWEEALGQQHAIVSGSRQFAAPEEIDARVKQEMDAIAYEIAVIKGDVEEMALRGQSPEEISWLEEDIQYLESELLELRGSPELHRRAFFLFESLALVRHFKMNSDRDAWHGFMEMVRSHADQIPAPWIIYTEQYRSVY